MGVRGASDSTRVMYVSQVWEMKIKVELRFTGLRKASELLKKGYTHFQVRWKDFTMV